MNQDGQQPWPIFIASMSRARLVGSSLCPMDERKRLMKEAAYGDSFCRDEPAYDQFIPVSSDFIPGEWTSITGRFSNGYFHWMTDDIPRLAALDHMPPATRILVRGPLRRYQRESFRLLGLEERVRPVQGRHFLLERYHFSSPVGMTGCVNPYAVSWLRGKFVNHLRPCVGMPEKLFITRRGKTRGIINQDDLAVRLSSMGWAVIDLEELSLERQIALFANASFVVAEHGAALTNLLWCRHGTKVLELCADNFLNGCYEAIALCVGLDHYFEVFEADAGNRIRVPFERLMSLIDD